MTPVVAKRGHSFKGAGQYYLHDKKAASKERVEWTHTHNIPTDDPEKAMKWMAYTAMNKDKLKRQAGIKNTGRKSNDEPVYSFALGWHPEQKPEKPHMLDLAFDALDLLGLKNHESVIVAHNETDHPHIHVITNLVNPENGKTVNVHNDYLRLSKWAEAYEKEHGKIYCEERVKNNQRRRNGEQIRYREVKVDKALVIQNLYNQCDSGKAFKAALELEGYTLAKGDKRGFVLVDEQGKISSLSRQLKGQRAKDLNARLSDLKDIPHAQTIANERQYFMRDDYETERQKRIVDAAIEHEKKKDQAKKKQIEINKIQIQTKAKAPVQKSFAEELDQVRKAEFQKDQKARRKEEELRSFYKREDYVKRIEELKQSLKKDLSRFKEERLKSELSDLQKTVRDIDTRMEEQGLEPDDPAKKDYSKTPDQSQDIKQAKTEPEKEISKEEKREKLRQQYKKRSKGRDNDFEPNR